MYPVLSHQRKQATRGAGFWHLTFIREASIVRDGTLVHSRVSGVNDASIAWIRSRSAGYSHQDADDRTYIHLNGGPWNRCERAGPGQSRRPRYGGCHVVPFAPSRRKYRLGLSFRVDIADDIEPPAPYLTCMRKPRALCRVTQTRLLAEAGVRDKSPANSRTTELEQCAIIQDTIDLSLLCLVVRLAPYRALSA